MPTQNKNQPPVDFLLITALEDERDAVLCYLPDYRQLQPSPDDIRIYYQATLNYTFPNGETGKYSLVLMQLLGMGRVQAATATADAIRRWSPNYILLIGIAGGIAEMGVHLGDILISSQIVDYELQKTRPDGPEIRWEVHRTDARLLNASNSFSWNGETRVYRPDRGRPERHVGPIASGDKVIAFEDVIRKYHTIWPKLIGVEMEAGGGATAAFQASDPPGFFMVRAVSDLADQHKDSEKVKWWRGYACDAAASYAISWLKSGPVLPKVTQSLPDRNNGEEVRKEQGETKRSASPSLPSFKRKIKKEEKSLDEYANYLKAAGDYILNTDITEFSLGSSHRWFKDLTKELQEILNIARRTHAPMPVQKILTEIYVQLATIIETYQMTDDRPKPPEFYKSILEVGELILRAAIIIGSVPHFP